MKYWITTDTHFNHNKMIEYCGRPENFEALTKKHLKSMVSDKDLLVHLGDVCIGNDLVNNEWFNCIPCKKILVRGNHDSKSVEWYMNHGWDLCVDRFDLKLFGKKIAFTHIPVGWDGYFDINIHGHLHNANFRRQNEETKKTLNGYHKLVAIENTDYKPVNLKKIV